MLPIFSCPHVYHIGTLNPSNRGRQFRSSLEGNALSVSNCPSAWRQIARLGGSPLHKLSAKAGPLKFLDGLAASAPGPLRDGCLRWARREGLATDTTVWRAWQEDEEGGAYYLACRTREEALIEADGDERALEVVESVVGTSKLADLMKAPEVTTDPSLHLVIQAWAELRLGPALGLHGVWWNEMFRPESLSAPRGAIFPGAVARLHRETIDWSLVSDEGPDFEPDRAAPRTEAEPGLILR